MSRTTRTMAIVLTMLVMPLALAAQQQQPPAEVQALMAELQQVQAQLQPVQQQALQDSALQAQQSQVADAVRQAMIAANPGIGPKVERLEALMEEARAAQAAGDAEKIAALTNEAQTLEPEVRAAQAQALARPDIEERIELFQTQLARKMVEIEPEAAPLIARRNELNNRLRAALGGG